MVVKTNFNFVVDFWAILFLFIFILFLFSPPLASANMEIMDDDLLDRPTHDDRYKTVARGPIGFRRVERGATSAGGHRAAGEERRGGGFVVSSDEFEDEEEDDDEDDEGVASSSRDLGGVTTPTQDGASTPGGWEVAAPGGGVLPEYPDEYAATLKVLVIGASGVGKTARECFFWGFGWFFSRFFLFSFLPSLLVSFTSFGFLAGPLQVPSRFLSGSSPVSLQVIIWLLSGFFPSCSLVTFRFLLSYSPLSWRLISGFLPVTLGFRSSFFPVSF